MRPAPTCSSRTRPTSPSASASFYDRDAEIVNPPVDVDHFLVAARATEDGHYLAFGRVVPYKRVDLAVAACSALGRRLLVAGDGRAMEPCAPAPPERRVEFLGKVADARRDELLGGARALLFPGEEDFGIVPVEAQAAGVPVIAYGVGGATETVRDGVTGTLFGEQTEPGSPRRSSASRRSSSTNGRSGRTRGASGASGSAPRWRR